MEPESDITRLGALIHGIRIAMLTTQGSDGQLRSRPMAVQEAEFDGDLWFFTSVASGKVSEIEHDAHVNVAFADTDHQRYVSVAGRASLVDDPAKKAELWSPAFRAWFPEGLDDPRLTLLKVHAESAEYWDSPSGPVAMLTGFVKALVTGRPAEVGEHATVALST
jgi:general stress protein 26